MRVRTFSSSISLASRTVNSFLSADTAVLCYHAAWAIDASGALLFVGRFGNVAEDMGRPFGLLDNDRRIEKANGRVADRIDTFGTGREKHMTPPLRAVAAKGDGRAGLYPNAEIRRSRAESLQPRVDGFTFEGQDAEDAFVDTPQWFPADETLKRLDTQCEFAHRQRSLASEPSLPHSSQMCVFGIIGAVDDS